MHASAAIRRRSPEDLQMNGFASASAISATFASRRGGQPMADDRESGRMSAGLASSTRPHENRALHWVPSSTLLAGPAQVWQERLLVDLRIWAESACSKVR